MTKDSFGQYVARCLQEEAGIKCINYLEGKLNYNFALVSENQVSFCYPTKEAFLYSRSNILYYARII